MSHHSRKISFLWTFLFLLSQFSTTVNYNIEDSKHLRAKSRSQRSFQTSSLLSVHNVSEDASIGTVVASLAYFKEKPGDLYETNYTFRIAHDSDIHRQFSIEPKFGKVSVAKPLDREDEEIYRLRIEVTDRGCVHENGFLNISSLKTVDREGNRGKVLEVPIFTRDSGKPSQEAIRFLRIEIGDKNDNPMSNGFSTIHVYNYKGQMPSSVIGRVYVDDLDDWDVIDKDFKLKKSNEYFTVTNDGIITMSKDIPIGTYTLEVTVYDRIRKESATGVVKVVVDYLDEEALDNIGSLRIRGISAEDFLRPLPKGDTSPYERFRTQLASRLNLHENDIKLFSIMPMSGNTYPPYVEIFFAVRRPGPTSLQYGPAYSAYVSSTLLTGILERYKSSFESALQMPKSSIVLVNIDPCVYEQCTDGGCTRVVTAITDHPMVIMANKTSLVGVNLNISSVCQCPRSKVGRQCNRDSCLNGGICHNSANGFFCQCRESILNGSRCESRTRSFVENGFAWLKPIGSCDNVTISLEFMTNTKAGALYEFPIVSELGVHPNLASVLTWRINPMLASILCPNLTRKEDREKQDCPINRCH
uniref:Uncharacterized protein n=1 Tax=Romanomermis culicivorax TaxID=13658 RepID=A0A915HMD2_ROMCU